MASVALISINNEYHAAPFLFTESDDGMLIKKYTIATSITTLYMFLSLKLL